MPDGTGNTEKSDSVASIETWAKAAAKCGAAFFDERRPGWAHEIKKPIDMGNTCNCMLGQLYGWYYDGLEKMDIDPPQAHYLGLNLRPEELRDDSLGCDSHFEILSVAWEEERKARVN